MDEMSHHPNPDLHETPTADVEITLSRYGCGKVVVNGINIANMVCGIRLESDVKKIPIITLRLIPKHLRIHCDAEVLQIAEFLPFADAESETKVEVESRPGL